MEEQFKEGVLREGGHNAAKNHEIIEDLGLFEIVHVLAEGGDALEGACPKDLELTHLILCIKES